MIGKDGFHYGTYRRGEVLIVAAAAGNYKFI